MSKIVVLTIGDFFNPSLSGVNDSESKVIIYVTLSAFFWLKTRSDKFSQEKLEKFWRELIASEDRDKNFNRTGISKNSKAKDIYKKLENNIDDFVFDFMYIKELYKKLERDFENNNLDFIAEKIKEELNDRNNSEVLKNYFKALSEDTEDDLYCGLINQLLSNKIDKGSNREIVSIEVLSKIEEVLNLSNENEHFKKILPKISDQIFNKNNQFIEDEFIAKIDTEIIQKDIELSLLLNEQFYPTQLVNNTENITFSLDNSLNAFSEFIYKLKNKNSIALLNGIEGSGKTILSLKMCLESAKLGFYPVYINIDNTNLLSLKDKITETNKSFIVIDGLDKINLSEKNTQQQIRNFLENLLEKNRANENIILLNVDFEKDKMQKNLLMPFLKEIFSIASLEEKDNPWIKTIMQKVIFEQLETKIQNTFDLYYVYIDKIIESLSKKLSGIYSNKNVLKNLFGQIAYKSLLDPVKIQDYNLDDLTINLISKSIILKIESLENGGQIIFDHQIFQNILASDYVMINISAEELASDLKNQSLEEIKCKQLMLIISSRITNSNKHYIQKKPALIKGMLYHLRQQRDLENEEKIIDFIDDENLIDKERKVFLLDKARSLYNRYGDYINSVKYTMQSLAINSEDQNYNAESFSHLSSCAIDLFLPETAIYLIDKAYQADNILEEIKINLLGNYARAYLKLGNFSKAEYYFQEKLDKHKKLNLKNEILRDQTDLILLYFYMYRENKDLSLFDQALSLAIQTVKSYDEDENVLFNLSGKKAFIYRNISYFLPYLSTDNSQLIDFLNDFENNPGPEKSPLGIYQMNLALHKLLQGNKAEAEVLLSNSAKNLDTYKEQLYLNFALQYYLKNDKSIKNQAIENYNNLKKESNQIKEILLENIANLPEENFKLINIFVGKEIISAFKNLFVF